MYFGNNVEFAVWIQDLERIDEILAFLSGEQCVVLEKKPFQLASGGRDGFGGFGIRKLFVVHGV